MADMSIEAVSPEQMKCISGYLENWDSIGFEDRRLVVDGLVSTIRATSESVQIEWKI
jgi:site-specific DNA recombinase